MKTPSVVRRKKADLAGLPAAQKAILAAIDFSPVTDAVIRRGLELARAFQARLELLHVSQPPIYITGDADNAPLTAAAGEAADRRLARFAAGLRPKHPWVETKRLTGVPVILILGEAIRVSADYIVIGSHGYGAIYELLMGSTAGGILSKAPCPVVIVPAAK